MKLGKKLSIGARALQVVGAGLLFLLLLAPGARADQAPFPFRDGDRVVFLGDSITEQRLYTTFLETYLLTRFPNWKLRFRNAGWGGDTSWLQTRGIPPEQALDRDVLFFKPTVVTIDFSMNDAGYGAFRQDLYDRHVNGMRDIVRWLKRGGVRPVVLTTSADENQKTGPILSNYNLVLERFAEGDRQVAKEANAAFADQLHPFFNAIDLIRSTDPKARVSGDAIHPGPAGHLLMADAVLKALNAPRLVSSATLSVDSKARAQETRNCKVTGVQFRDGVLSFDRQDEALPFPIHPEAMPILRLVPVVQDLDDYSLTVKGLEPGSYRVAVDGITLTTVTSDVLASGLNLALLAGPLTDPAQRVMAKVFEKNNLYFERWRAVQLGSSFPDPKGEGAEERRQARLKELDDRVASLEAEIDGLRKPRLHHFEISRAQ
ncbi:MAG TPA: SGNH/GDSL hydrolase family protein [Armatimonadota bacterium]|jgi:lysophospholipase L1-like esterase